MPSATGNEKPISVVMIDDEPDQILLKADSLAERGFEVLTFDNPKEGLAYLLKGHTDIGIVDITMPFISGIDILKEVNKKLSAPPIMVVHSGKSSSFDRELSYANGAQLFLSKSSSPSEFAVMLENFISNHLQKSG